jgi:hypothetical protein
MCIRQRYFRFDILCLLLLLTGIFACKREAAPAPSGDKYGYQLPQGNHPYDDAIVAFYKKYHCYILYKYTPVDFKYAITTSLGDTSWLPDPADVQPALNFLLQECLQLYPDSFLYQVLPYRILLPSRIDSLVRIAEYGMPIISKYVSGVGFATTDYMMAFGWANHQLPQQTPAQLKMLRGWLHQNLWKRAYNAQQLEMPDSFALYSPDYISMPNEDNFNFYAVGLVARIHDAYKMNNPYCLGRDFTDFIAAITSKSAAEWESTLLSPAVDVSGLIKVKRGIVLRYYQRKYGIDLQAIGNRP